MPRRQLLRRLCVAATVSIFGPLAMAGAAAGAPPPGPPAAAAGSGAVQPAAVPPLDRLTVSSTQVAFGLQRPTAIFAPDDGSGRLLITEKTGTVRVYHPSTGLATAPLLDISARVDVSGNERGLLGIVTTPNFATTHTIYVAYTSLPNGEVTLSRFVLDRADQTPVPAAREQVVLTQPHIEFANHNGGQLAFGPDGYLYWSIGDGGGADDVLNSGQNLGTLLGKILRLDVNRSCSPKAYCVPAGNPFVNTAGARPEIWAYGLRNPWRFSFDRQDGSLWIADVGQGTYEEVDHLAPNVGGANFGWSCREGPQVFNADRCAAGARYVEPVAYYRTSFDGCAVIGGFVYRGRQFADIAAGTYLATDYCSNPAYAIRPGAAGGAYQALTIGELPIQPTTLGVDADGELYLANDLPGQLHKISFAVRPPPVSCRVTYRVDSQWGTGFTTTITLTNTGTAPINGWSLGWTFPGSQRASNWYNAVGSQDGAAVTAKNAAWNQSIAPGGTVTLGFTGSYTGTNPAPTGYAVNGSACG